MTQEIPDVIQEILKKAKKQEIPPAHGSGQGKGDGEQGGESPFDGQPEGGGEGEGEEQEGQGEAQGEAKGQPEQNGNGSGKGKRPMTEEEQKLFQAVKEILKNEDLDLEFTLPDATLQDGLRRNANTVRECSIPLGQDGKGAPEDVRAVVKEVVKEFTDALSVKRVLQTKVIIEGKKLETGVQHKQFANLLTVVRSGLNAYLVGPAGSGKTTAAQQVSTCLEVPFFFTGAITSEFKLTGFVDANGRVICPAFRKAYEHGGVFLFDEIDASMPQAVLAFNAAIANSMMDFPDKTVMKHENFYCIAAANTYGQGADRVYVGRNQMDGATIDRFAFLDWEYDHALELALAGDDEWVAYVQAVRTEVAKHRIRHVVSPRASIQGAKLLANGMKRQLVEDLTLWKGLDKDSRVKVLSGMPKPAPKAPPKPMLAPEKEKGLPPYDMKKRPQHFDDAWKKFAEEAAK